MKRMKAKGKEILAYELRLEEDDFYNSRVIEYKVYTRYLYKGSAKRKILSWFFSISE